MKIEAKNEHLIQLAYAKMHFGKYKGWYLSDIPEAYFVWFKQKGFPNKQMEAVYELKVNGLEALLKNIRKVQPK